MYQSSLEARLADFCEKNVGAFDYQEAVISRICKEVVKNEDVVVDGGAHTGRHTKTLATLVGENGRVYAFEPLPSLAYVLIKRFENQSNVIVIPKAVLDENGFTSFTFVKNNPSYSGIHISAKLANAEMEKINVPTVTLDDVLTTESKCRLIKMDIEGAEYYALSGAKNILNKFSPMILFENSLKETATKYGYTKEQFFSLFSQCGYEIFNLFGKKISDSHWESCKLNFDNYIAVKSDEDKTFIEEKLPGILFTVLLDMNEVSVDLNKSIFRIMEWIAEGCKVVLFGAGNRARLVLDQYPIPFDYLVDNDPEKWGKELNGIPVKSPQTLVKVKKHILRIAIISLFGDEIEKQLLKMKFNSKNILKVDVR